MTPEIEKLARECGLARDELTGKVWVAYPNELQAFAEACMRLGVEQYLKTLPSNSAEACV